MTPPDGTDDATRRQRWRLVLGDGSQSLGPLDPRAEARDRALAFLYDRERAQPAAARPGGSPRGGQGPSALTVPAWVGQVRELFPHDVAHVLTTDAVERYAMTEVITDVRALEQVEPSPELLAAILASRHLMDDDVLAAARAVVRVVVADLRARLRPAVVRALGGTRDPYRRVRRGTRASFDAHATIRANLKNAAPGTGPLVISDALFTARTRPDRARWQVIVAVDQSGSMVSSVIHAAVTASIFHELPTLRTHLVAFDTSVVDLTDRCADPVETLLGVQLGGGTDITAAVAYCAGLVTAPRTALVVLISDLYEGGSVARLVSLVAGLTGQGTRVLVLGALTDDGHGQYDQDVGERLVRAGAHVAVMSPLRLAEWVAQVVR